MDFLFPSFGLLIILVIIWIWRIYRRSNCHDQQQQIRDSQAIFGDLSKHIGHEFIKIDVYDKPTYSSSSGQPLLFGGLRCEKCGICVGKSEKQEAINYLKCKPSFIEDGATTPKEETCDITKGNSDQEPEDDSFGVPRDHHWVMGNLPLLSICSVCKKPAGVEPKLIDYFCSLCHVACHDKCLGTFMSAMSTRFCTLGYLAPFVVPPWCVRAIKKGLSASDLLKGQTHSKMALNRITFPPNLTPEQWRPVFVFANRLSGNGVDAEHILSAFSHYLNPTCQVFDLAVTKNLQTILMALIKFLPHEVESIIILVAGGDGTVRWIADTVSKLSANEEVKVKFEIAVFPLGTGNDLAQALGLGSGYVGGLDAFNYLTKNLVSYQPLELDRWSIDVSNLKAGSAKLEPRITRNSARQQSLWLPHMPSFVSNRRSNTMKTYFMYNYFSIGADALVTLSFAQRRSTSRWLCNSRLINKLIYGIYGLIDMFHRECHDLHEHLDLTLDGKVVEQLPKIEALVLLNISSWGGGCRLLELEPPSGVEFKQQRFDDGVIEVLGVYSSVHVAQMMAGFSSPVRIGQARKVEILLKKKFPIQIDGEPQSQKPARISVSCCGKVCVLNNATVKCHNE